MAFRADSRRGRAGTRGRGGAPRAGRRRASGFSPVLAALGAALAIVGLGAATIPLLRAAPDRAAASASGNGAAGYRRGMAALDRGDARTARVELMNAIRADPRSAPAHVAQARALLMLSRGADAQMELDRAVELGARVAALRPWLAWAALEQGRPEDALAQARSTDGQPEDALLLARFEGRAAQALGRMDEAAQAFERARRIAPDDAALWMDVTRFRFATGDQAAALAASETALRFAPKSPEALTLRGLMVREQYGPVAASAWFDAALRQDPNDVPALIDYAATLADIGQASRALALSRRALALSPGLPRAYFVQAVIAARAGDYDLARAMLGYTRGALDGQAATRLLRGVLQLQAGNAALAEEQLEPLLAGQPLNLRARLFLARAYYDDGRYGDAERTLFPLVERADASDYALSLAARIHEALGNRAVADIFLGRAAAMTRGPADVFRGAGEVGAVAGAADADPAQAAPNLRYVRALLQAGQGTTALSRARQLAAQDAGAPDAWILLGDSLAYLGRSAEAAQAYQRAADLRFDENAALRIVAAWQRAGRPQPARRALALFWAQNPMNVEAQRLAAVGWLADGDYGRALAVLQGLRARLGNEDALLMAYIARAYVGLGRAEAALPYAAHAWRLQPASAVVADAFGWTLLQADGDGAAARELLEKAARLAPGEPLVRLHLGQLYAAAGETAKARAALRAAAAVPGFPQRGEALKALQRL